jgi:protein-tyrosine phosphatase
VIVRSDNLGHLTAAGRQSMADYGVTTVIDLRSESEALASPSPFASEPGEWPPIALPDAAEGPQWRAEGSTAEGAPRYVHVPLVDDATFPRLNEASEMSDRYVLMLDRRQAALGAIFDAMAQEDGTILFHCFAGKDRTGLVAAMMLALADVAPAAIGADYAATDVQMATRYKEWIAAAKPEDLDTLRKELRCPPEWMLSAIEHLESKWGGVAAYLEAAGVSGAAITRLETKLS